ncbi:MAG: type V CRISPR-associated protein Cas12a/Cpf1 [bacterium]
MNIFKDFTKQFSLSKTLRFELKPIGKTEEWIKKHDIVSVEENELKGKDAKRAEYYKYVKILLDKMHRLFIEEALGIVDKSKLLNKLQEISKTGEIEIDKDLKDIFKNLFDCTANKWIDSYKSEMPAFLEKDLKEVEDKLANESNNQRKKGFKSAVNAIEKNIKGILNKIKKDGVSAIYSNSEATALLEWKISSGNIKATFNELGLGIGDETIPQEKLIEFLRTFYQFATYFSGFNENRKNIYDLSGNKSTSIINRTINENFAFHLKNMEKWEVVKQSLERSRPIFEEKKFDHEKLLYEIETQLDFKFDDFFTVDFFCDAMNQSGIDRYNEIIGGQPALDGSSKLQGINEFINLCRQQANARRQQFPVMQELYKQILSKSDKTFIPEFLDDKEMFVSIKSFGESNLSKSNLIDEFVKTNSELQSELQNEKANLYLPKEKITAISNKITGNWSTLNYELLEQLGETTFNSRKWFSFEEIENAVSEGKNYSGSLLSFFDNEFKTLLKKSENSWNELEANGVLNGEKIDSNRSQEKDKGFEQIAAIKKFLDSLIELSGFVRDWQATKEILNIENRNRDWYEHLDKFINQFQVISLYNMVRNHLTKKPVSKEKMKINFENYNLLAGWDRNKEKDNYCVLLEKDGLYFLGVMTPKSNRIFDYEKNEKIKKDVLAGSNEKSYRKINYKLLPGPNKMLPRVFFAGSNKDIFNPSEEIIKIKKEKLYSKAAIETHGIKNLYKYIDFCKQSLINHPEWSQSFGFTKESFSETSDFTSVDQFYNEVERQGYSITFDNIKENYINEKVENGDLYLFQIYSKDFSQNKKNKGTDNIHTIYWKGLFSPENLKKPVLKLNGQAEIFFRKASLNYKNEIVKNGHHHEKLKDKFSYPIIKDRRFTQNKFFFHCPIALNFGAPSNPYKFNDSVRSFLKNNPDINIIGIDRGEKHLLYYSVVNQKGKIIEQGSLNSIDNGFVPKGETGVRKIDYHSKLDKIESNRDKARKSWSTIENIKELKAGYLSQVVHKLSELIIKHNAVVVLEDLNYGFKRGRFGVEKQIYQKFEKALIDKLNHLVFKKESPERPGGYLNAYQLTNKFESFQKMGKQSGILFYTTASYTSTTDPVTGFLKNVYPNYQSVEKSIEFWKSFDSIKYNSEKDRFEFTYTLGKVATKNMYKEKDEEKVDKKQWTVCSSVTRSRYVKAMEKQTEEQKQSASSEQIGNKGRHEIFFVTDELKATLKNAGIDYKSNSDLKAKFLEQDTKRFHSSMIYLFNAIMTMRVTDSSKEKGTKENDFIQSPVEPFFDSRYAKEDQPENGDANGAYNIARKGLCILQNINKADDVSKADIAISKQQWQNFVQKN